MQDVSDQACAGSGVRPDSHSGVDRMRIGHSLQGDRVSVNLKITARKKTRAKTTKQKTTPRGATIRKGKRVKVQRRALKYAIAVDSPAYRLVEEYPRNDFNFYRTVLGPNLKSGKYGVRFDVLPAEDNEYNLVRGNLVVLGEGEDEVEYDHDSQENAEIAEQCSGTIKESKAKPAQDAIDAFLMLSSKEQKSAKSVVYPFDAEATDSIKWTILE